MQLAIRAETIDPVETARLANEAFGGGADFRPARLTWLYERAFSGGTEVLGLFDGERKVGQVALVRQRVRVAGGMALAVALIDLFILKAFRSREAISGLYGEAERVCRAQGVRFLLAVPNGNAAGVNKRFLGMREFMTLAIRAGVAAPLAGPVLHSAAARDLDQREAQALFARYAPSDGDGLYWTGESLWQRLQDPLATYGVHATDNLLLVSARRVLRRVPHTLLCAFLARGGTTVGARDVRAVTTARLPAASPPAVRLCRAECRAAPARLVAAPAAAAFADGGADPRLRGAGTSPWASTASNCSTSTSPDQASSRVTQLATDTCQSGRVIP